MVNKQEKLPGLLDIPPIKERQKRLAALTLKWINRHILSN